MNKEYTWASDSWSDNSTTITLVYDELQNHYNFIMENNFTSEQSIITLNNKQVEDVAFVINKILEINQ